MTQRAPRLRALAASVALLASLGGTAACSGGTARAALTSTSSTTTAATSRSTAGLPVRAGLARLVGGPVLAVKIDNTPAARPRIGIDQADVVYVEPVEGGLTRLLAVFSRHLPAQVGPVRSGRESDVALLANYGPVALAYSGSSSYTARILARGTQVNLSFDQNARGYHRDHSRPAPYNVIGAPTELLARAGGSVRPRDIGFRYGPDPAGGQSGVEVSTAWPSSMISMAWSPARKQYLVTTDGRAEVSPQGHQYGATTVVVQYVTTRPSGNRDVNGRPTPVVQLTGSGTATVLRDGHAWSATWSRGRVTGPTSFVAAGHPVTFAPNGTVWVLLVAKGQKVSVR